MLVSSTFVTWAAVSTVSLIAPDSTETVSLVSVSCFSSWSFGGGERFQIARPFVTGVLSIIGMFRQPSQWLSQISQQTHAPPGITNIAAIPMRSSANETRIPPVESMTFRRVFNWNFR